MNNKRIMDYNDIVNNMMIWIHGTVFLQLYENNGNRFVLELWSQYSVRRDNKLACPII